MKDLKHVQSFTETSATMLIYAPIGENGINGEYFAEELEWLKARGCKNIEVRINSGGGSVLHGLSIFSAIYNANESGCIINTHNDGIAASMAGVILMAGKEVFSKDYAKLMLHDPFLRGYAYEELDEKERAYIDTMKAIIVKMFENRTNKTAEEIAQMMAVETWLSAEQALEGGFVDKIVSTKKPEIAPPTTENKVNAYYEAFAEYLKEPEIIVVEKPIEKPLPIIAQLENNMEKKVMQLAIIAALLGLSEDTTEQNVIDEIKKNRANGIKGDAMLNETAFLKTENEALKAKFEGTRKAQATALVEDAIKAHKIRPATKEKWLAIALSDYDTAKDTFDSMNGHPQLSNLTSTEDAQANYSFTDWVTKDPKGLEQLKNNQPAVYASLYKKEYGYEPSYK